VSIEALNKQRIAVIGDFIQDGVVLKDGTEGTIYDPLWLYAHDDTVVPDNDEAFNIIAESLPGEFVIKYDGQDGWWYASPEEEGVTWRKI
jgi:hypothetical protein